MGDGSKETFILFEFENGRLLYRMRKDGSRKPESTMNAARAETMHKFRFRSYNLCPAHEF